MKYKNKKKEQKDWVEPRIRKIKSNGRRALLIPICDKALVDCISGNS